MRQLALLTAAAFFASVAAAGPLTPTINGFDFNFGAFNAAGPFEYATNNTAPDTSDTLVYTSGPTDHEVTAFWPTWPMPPVYPVFDPNGVFGGDLVLGVKFTGQDAPYTNPAGDTIDVSLTGTGLDPSGADLFIYGSTSDPNGTYSGLLWALDLQTVSLYGRSGAQWGTEPQNSYVLEGAGTIVGGAIAQVFGLVGQSGVMRGHLDFFDRPAFWIPPLYDPLTDVPLQQIRAAYSGETGPGYAVPEPAGLAVLAVAGLALARRRGV